MKIKKYKGYIKEYNLTDYIEPDPHYAMENLIKLHNEYQNRLAELNTLRKEVRKLNQVVYGRGKKIKQLKEKN